MIFVLKLCRSQTITSTGPYWLHRLSLFSVGGDYTRERMPGSENHWVPSWSRTVSRSKDFHSEEKMVGVPSRKKVECKTDGFFSSCGCGKGC